MSAREWNKRFTTAQLDAAQPIPAQEPVALAEAPKEVTDAHGVTGTHFEVSYLDGTIAACACRIGRDHTYQEWAAMMQQPSGWTLDGISA